MILAGNGGGFSLDRASKRAEKYEGRVAFGTKHVTIFYTMRD